MQAREAGVQDSSVVMVHAAQQGVQAGCWNLALMLCMQLLNEGRECVLSRVHPARLASLTRS